MQDIRAAATIDTSEGMFCQQYERFSSATTLSQVLGLVVNDRTLEEWRVENKQGTELPQKALWTLYAFVTTLVMIAFILAVVAYNSNDDQVTELVLIVNPMGIVSQLLDQNGTQIEHKIEDSMDLFNEREREHAERVKVAAMIVSGGQGTEISRVKFKRIDVEEEMVMSAGRCVV